MQNLKGKIALITGGGSGIGRAIATELSGKECAVAVADVHMPDDLPESIKRHTCDVTSATDVASLYTSVTETLGIPDIVVCSAGRGIHEKLTEGDPEKWQQVINTNLMGVLRIIRAFVPGMVEKGAGHVLLISSVAAGQAYAYGGIYAATKAALEVVAETLRLEVLPAVKVTVVAPGVTDTAFFRNTISGFQTTESIGYGAISAENVAQAIVYALSQPPGVAINQITIRPVAQPF